jgi:spore maturation protein CgeB
VKLVVFGLTISSSWGNGHATLWRGLCRSLARQGHQVVFFERDVPYYASHRDLTELTGGQLVLYKDWPDVTELARAHSRDADVAMVTSYCPDALLATDLLLDSPAPIKAFFDLDTPVTLDRLATGAQVPYVPSSGLSAFDIVLSYTGGNALSELQTRLGARRVIPLYGHVDPEVHRPVTPVPAYGADLSYLGTYAADRQAALETLFISAARQQPTRRFSIGGAQYPQEFPWTPNIFFVRHLPPIEHPAFFSSSRLTLNITRRAMAEMGYCPSGRLFEAAACAAPILTDTWDGLDAFFTPGEEVLIARTTQDVLDALELSDAELHRIGRRARQRTLDEHTADHRAAYLLRSLETMSQAAASAS